MTQNQSKNFSELWNFESKELSRNITIFDMAAKGTYGLSAFLIARKGMSPRSVGVGAALSAAFYMLQDYAKKMGLESVKYLLEDLSRPADADIQEIVEKLFKKAGITDKKPVVKIVTPQGLPPKVMAMFSTMGTFPEGTENGFCEADEIVVFIGQKSLDLLSREELTAILAHEVSHNVAIPPDLQTIFNKVAGSLNAGMSLGKLLAGEGPWKDRLKNRWKETLPLKAVDYGRKYVMGKMKRFDEARADRNSLALYPHPTALKTGLEKMEDLILQELNIQPGSTAETIFDLQRKAFGTHKFKDSRIQDIDKFYAEVTAFYQANGLDMDPEEITGPINNNPAPPPLLLLEYKPEQPTPRL